MELVPFLLLFALMWLLLIRPQQARVRKQRELVASIQVGDEVLTAGGIVGIVRVLGDEELRLETSPGVELRVIRAAVTRRLGPDADAGTDDPTGADGLGPDHER
ncbi:MAG: preprotein translocase subunit YajC [Actinomycetota bacterium]|nr:preprotein translocase subunit YajC [Actinomycetota bacterium]